MRNWGHNTLRVGVSPLWMSDCSVACRSAWRSLCGASPSGQATAVHRAPRSGPCLEACPCDPVPPTASIPAAYFGLTRGFCTIRSLLSACRRLVAPLMVQFPPLSVGVIGRRVAPGSSYRAILQFGSALNVGRARPCASHGAIPAVWWGFCTIRSLPSACRRRVAPLLLQFPPFAGSEVAVRGGVAPTGKTASATNADNGGGCGRAVLRLGGSDVWPRVSLARSPLRCEREPAIACANRLYRT